MSNTAALHHRKISDRLLALYRYGHLGCQFTSTIVDDSPDHPTFRILFSRPDHHEPVPVTVIHAHLRVEGIVDDVYTCTVVFEGQRLSRTIKLAATPDPEVGILLGNLAAKVAEQMMAVADQFANTTQSAGNAVSS